jgi:16S rRNA (guanine527-N7)-methyltransferase
VIEAISIQHSAVSESTHEKLRAYLEEVLRANREFNLTAVRDFDAAWNKHILDSLQGLRAAQGGSTPVVDNARSAIDVGTGAGFPGVVLAIARPALQVTLLEATRKKCNFLEAAAPSNVGVLCERAEVAGHDAKLRESFDIAVARAVGSFSEVCELCLPFVKIGGHVLLWRGQNAPQEITESKRALQTLGGAAGVLLPYQLPGHEMQYHLVLIEKRRSTPKQFPRRDGLPKQKPL